MLGPLAAIGLDLLALVVASLVMLLSAVYIAINPNALHSGFMQLVPAQRRPQAERIISRVKDAWMGWFVAIGIDMLVLGGLLYTCAQSAWTSRSGSRCSRRS